MVRYPTEKGAKLNPSPTLMTTWVYYLVFIQPIHECFLESGIRILTDISCEANDVEVPLKIIDDHSLPDSLFVFCASIVFVFHLNDALPEILKSKSLWRWSIDINHLVCQDFARFGFRKLFQQLFDDIKFSSKEWILFER